MMAQNTSSAVMQQRKEPHDSLDFFPTPPWATRALFEVVFSLMSIRLPFSLPPDWLAPRLVWEPACGRGHMARPLAEYVPTVIASDVHDYGYGDVQDFLFQTKTMPKPDWIITNPPFRLAKDFILAALRQARCGVAILVRTAFLEGIDRYKDLYRKTPPTFIFQFVERVPMEAGCCAPDTSTATAYAWMVWITPLQCDDSTVMWIPPCRKQLERPEDYDPPEYVEKIRELKKLKKKRKS